MRNNIVLLANNNKFEGWTEAIISRSLANISGTFNLTVSNCKPLNLEKWDLYVGNTCSIEIDGETVINGYIDDFNIRYDANQHLVEIMGRDRTCDLVDCCFNGKNEFKNQTLKAVIEKICDTFAIEVKIDNDVRSICNEKVSNDSTTINYGMNIYELIVELCKSKGVLATSYGDGRLVLTKAGLNGRANDPIQLGYNIYQGLAEFSNRERFSSYVTYAQGKGNDNKSLESTITVKSKTVEDKIIKRTRPFIKLIDAGDIATCDNYAAWEKAYRTGKSRKFTYTLIEFTQSNGYVWQINQKVHVKDEYFGIEQDLLIESVEFAYSNNQGSTTKLGVVDQSTYDIIEPKKSYVKTVIDPPASREGLF